MCGVPRLAGGPIWRARSGKTSPWRDVDNVTVHGWMVYILECGDGTLYTGITIDLMRRLAAHQRGVASKYTRARLPVRVIYEEAHHSRSSALRREALIKTLTHEDKLGLILRSPSSPPPESQP